MSNDNLPRRMAEMAERDDRLGARESERYLWLLGCAASFALGIITALGFVRL